MRIGLHRACAGRLKKDQRSKSKIDKAGHIRKRGRVPNITACVELLFRDSLAPNAWFMCQGTTVHVSGKIQKSYLVKLLNIHFLPFEAEMHPNK